MFNKESLVLYDNQLEDVFFLLKYFCLELSNWAV